MANKQIDNRTKLTAEEQDRIAAIFARAMRCDMDTARDYLISEEWDMYEARASLRGDRLQAGVAA